MRIFFDSEFTGLHKATTLISIGFVSESGREFYAEITDYDESQIDLWIQENVIAHLSETAQLGESITYHTGSDNGISLHGRHDREMVHQWLITWFAQFGQVQLYSDCLSFDWVLFCDLFGNAFEIPDNVSPAPHDINQDIAAHLGISDREAFDVDREEFAGMTDGAIKHNALWDAKVIRGCWERIANKSPDASRGDC